ncbi:MAG: mannose-1-phosphate guanylyltransferase/mannose-6-phosphate isomerase [Proteobacteria bacterium]|nr:mannose-1-phosphate guanylyltransferase/mannose-6-phosphate isomerase [Pseudomonadota bacterium]
MPVESIPTAILPVILAGGGGTRLWPLSRGHYPKQFLALGGNDSLLQQTLTRLAGAPHLTPAAPLVVCNEEHRFLVAEQARLSGVALASIVLEPVGRNTAPALCAAAALATRDGSDPLLLMMPSDHLIADRAAFQAAVEAAAAQAEQGQVVTFGIVPTRAETGYGYIELGAALGAEPRASAHVVKAFKEKPDADTALRYIDSGGYLWNAGIFMMRASVWLAHAERLCPAIAGAAQRAASAGRQDGDFFRLDAEAFGASPSDSIDYAVMEPLSVEGGVRVVALDAGWSDVGSWASLWEVSPHDSHGNVTRGDVCTIDSQDNLVFAEHRLVATLGCADLVVVETADAVLVADKRKTQDVKHVVDWLTRQNREERLTHRRVYRPWGSYEGIDMGTRFQVKHIVVNPGASLSLQMHHHRAEHWIVVSGTARVTKGDEVFLLGENESTYIPLGVRHRLENPGAIPLDLIEVQSGSYLGEDDIVRFEDRYNRVG